MSAIVRLTGQGTGEKKTFILCVDHGKLGDTQVSES